MLLEKGIDFWNGSYSCLVCQIELQQSNIHEHLQGFQHAMRAATREKEKNEKESKVAKRNVVRVNSKKFVFFSALPVKHEH